MVTNVSGEEVELVDVRLNQATGVQLVDSAIAPEEFASWFGLQDGWPGEGVPTAAAEALSPLSGTRLPAKNAARADDDEFTVVLRLRLTEAASFDGLVLTYRVGSETKVWQTPVTVWRFRVKDRCG